MALENKKIVSYEDSISSLSNYPSDDGISASQLKAMFDARADKEIKNSINGIIDELTSSDAAAQIGCKSGASIEEELSRRVVMQEGKELSSNDFTDAQIKRIDTALEHANSKSNPHKVVASQVETENGSDVEIELGILSSHAADIDNPHYVTAEQVETTKGLNLEQAVDIMESHNADVSNPHNVSVEQISANDGKSLCDLLDEKQDKVELTLIETVIVGYSKITDETAPEWIANTYYKNTGNAIEPVYKLTTAKPSDWETNWHSYFTYSPDGVVAVDRTEEPDGTPYDFDACYVDANILQGATTGTGGIAFYPSTESGAAIIGRAYHTTAVRTNIAVRHECLTYKLFGRWHTPAYLSSPVSNGAAISSTSNMPGYIGGNAVSDYPSIKRARISCVGTVWPSGSTIKIYGVRR